MKAIARLNLRSGKLERPWRTRKHQFVLQRDGRSRETLADDYEEAVGKVLEGYSIRMSDGRSPPTLVTPLSLTIDEAAGTPKDQLWAYTMPEPPFSRVTLEIDIRAALVAKAAQIYWIAGPKVADKFLGTHLNLSDVEATGKLLKLATSPFARVVFEAYDSAFRIGNAPTLPKSDNDRLATYIAAFTSGAREPHLSPADCLDSPLQRTMLAAYWRGLIRSGKLFNDALLDAPPIRRLAVLASMTEAAVRNALAKEKVKLPLKADDHDRVIAWLERTRGFTPLREDERYWPATDC